MKLYIDTSGTDAAIVAIVVDGKRYEKVSESRVHRAQMTLPLVEALLVEQGLAPDAITDIIVSTGPGSYTGLRVGVSVANALAFLLGVTVNGQKPPVVPVYE